MITPERMLMVYKGILYEFHPTGNSSTCALNKKNKGDCLGCSAGGNFQDACLKISQAFDSAGWHWRELKWKEGS